MIRIICKSILGGGDCPCCNRHWATIQEIQQYMNGYSSLFSIRNDGSIRIYSAQVAAARNRRFRSLQRLLWSRKEDTK